MTVDGVAAVLAVIAGLVVVLAWRRVHHQHREARARDLGARTGPAAFEPEHVAETHEAWALPLPVRVPRATYWPAVLALGVVTTGAGAIISHLMIAGGAAIVCLALTFWIRETLRGEDADLPSQ